jgi:chromate transporter
MERPAGRWPEVFRVFLGLGLTSFGGPVAHLGYFREAFVERRKWLGEAAYADLVALCQFLPGPASSQVGLSIGLSRAGLPGALAAWTGFTLPSALALLAFAYGVGAVGDALGGGWIAGLKIAAVAVVANALYGMATKLCPDRTRASFAAVAAALVIAVPGVWGQVGAILAAGLAGWALLTPARVDVERGRGMAVPVSRGFAVAALIAFFLLLGGLPLAAALWDHEALALFDAFYRAGALVFGGGHVVLPLLQAEVVPTGWVARDSFLAGYGAAQAVPGPLFTFSAFLGGAFQGALAPWLAAIVCLVAIFLPSVLLVLGCLPFWSILRARPGMQGALMGVNAGVVGLLAAAFYDPVWTAAIGRPADFALALAALVLLAVWRLSPVLVVALSALAGAGLAAV